MKQHRNKLLISGLVLVFLVAGFFFREEVAEAVGSRFTLSSGESNPSNTSGAVIGTTTLNYLSPGAGTTTITMDTHNTDIIDVNVFGVASTVATTDLRWTIEFSHSTSSVDSERVWFPAPQELEANRNGLGGIGTTTPLARIAKEYAFRPLSRAPHRVATSTATDETFDPNSTFVTSFKIKDVNARWTRVVFYIPTAGATLAESTALDQIPTSTSTNAGIYVHPVKGQPF